MKAYDAGNIHRRTGRTTRLLRTAAEWAHAGRAVYVVAHNHDQVRCLEREFRRLFEDPSPLGIKFETPEELGNFDWETMSLRGGHPNCRVLCDHYVIETRFSRILEALHAFDL